MGHEEDSVHERAKYVKMRLAEPRVRVEEVGRKLRIAKMNKHGLDKRYLSLIVSISSAIILITASAICFSLGNIGNSKRDQLITRIEADPHSFVRFAGQDKTEGEVNGEWIRVGKSDTEKVDSITLDGRNGLAISALSEFPDAQDISIYNMNVDTDAVFNQRSQASSVLFFRCNIISLRGIVELRELSHLHIEDCVVPKEALLGAVAECRASYLRLVNMKLESIPPHETLLNFERIDLGHNPFSDGSELRHLKLLKNLAIPNTGIEDLSFLEDLSQLVVLDIRNCDVIDLSPIASLPRLEVLYLSTDFEGTASFGRLVQEIPGCRILFDRSGQPYGGFTEW